MYPPGPFADSVASFRVPVDPPTTGPFDSPLFEVCINRDWLPFIAGSLKQLLLQATWSDMSDTDLQALQGRVFDLISAFGQVDAGCGIIPPSILCISGDWKDDKYHTEPDPSVACTPTYDNVVGWTGCDDGSSNLPKLGLIQTFDQSTFVRSYRVTGTIPLLWTGHLYITAYFGGSVVAAVDDAITGGTAVDFTWNCDVQADKMGILLVSNDATPLQTITLQSFEICYSGDFPLSGREDVWEIIVDFTTGDHGWSAVISSGDGQPRAYYTSGVGWIEWHSGASAHESDCRFQKTLSASHRFTSVEVFVSSSATLNQCYLFNFAYGAFTLPSGSNDVNLAMDVTASNMRMDFVDTVHNTTDLVVSKMIFRGVGIAPTDLA